jgi:hypothetical protein
LLPILPPSSDRAELLAIPSRSREPSARQINRRTCRIFAESTLSDERAKDIYAYIRTFKSNAPELKEIPMLNAIVEAASKPAKK